MSHIFVSNFKMHCTFGQTISPDKKILHTLQSNSMPTDWQKEITQESLFRSRPIYHLRKSPYKSV